MHFSFASVVLNFCFCLILTIDVSSSSSAPRAVPFTADKFAANHSSSIKATTNESTRQIFLHRNQLMQKKSFFGFLLVPYIICFFAAKGFWPIFPAFMQYQVNEMGKRVFSLSDDRIQQYCQGKFNFQGTCYRPGVFLPIPEETTVCPPATTTPAPPHVTTHKPVATTPAATETITIIIPAASSGAPAQSWDATSQKQKGQHAEELEKPSPNINIEIQNVFSFGRVNETVQSAQLPLANSPTEI